MGNQWIEDELGRARFAGSARGIDEAGHDVFQVELDSQRLFFGEYKTQLVSLDEYNIEINSIGFVAKDDVGMPNSPARVAFSSDEEAKLRKLIEKLILSPEAQRGVIPFSIKRGRFLGGVCFANDWIALKS